MYLGGTRLPLHTMAFYVLFALLSLCSGQTISPTASPSRTPSGTLVVDGWLGSPPCPYWLNKGVTGGSVIYVVPGSTGWTGGNCAAACQANSTCFAWWQNSGCRFYNNATTGFSANSGIAGVSAGALCQSFSPTRTPSPSTSSSPTPTPMPCVAPPGYFCSGGSATICPVGAFCAGGSALKVSCYPLTVCTVAGLSAQPPCTWSVTTLAGSGSAAYTEGSGTTASFSAPSGLAVSSSGLIYVADQNNHRIRTVSISSGLSGTLAGSGSGTWADGTGGSASFYFPYGAAFDATSGFCFVADTWNNRIRKVSPTGVTTTLAGSGSPAWTDGLGTAASFSDPVSLVLDSAGVVFVADAKNNRIRKITPLGAVTTLAGTGCIGYCGPPFADGAGTITATFNAPYGITVDSSGVVYVGDNGNQRVRRILPDGMVDTVAGSSLGWADGTGTSASFWSPLHLTAIGNLFLADGANNRIRMITPLGEVSTIAGLSASFQDGFGTASLFNRPLGIAGYNGTLYVGDQNNNRIRQLTCVPCPTSYYCFSGAPALCPAGAYCPLSSVNATLCPKGTFSNAGASICTPCFAGTYTSATGSASCQQCPGGHFCPPGTSSWASLNCGRGNYCPDGSGAPTPCPYQVPPTGGWGALQVQGPAFLAETARCLNHCFWNFSSGDGMLSKC